jgi:hypothetical protein
MLTVPSRCGTARNQMVFPCLALCWEDAGATRIACRGAPRLVATEPPRSKGGLWWSAFDIAAARGANAILGTFELRLQRREAIRTENSCLRRCRTTRGPRKPVSSKTVMTRILIAKTSRYAAGRNKATASRKGHGGVPIRVGRSSVRLILLAMMKSFSCRPLIFMVFSEMVARPQPKLMSG